MGAVVDEMYYVCVSIQGIKGALGDPGLPGPTGIRGGFGERVSDTYMSVFRLMLEVFSLCKTILKCL